LKNAFDKVLIANRGEIAVRVLRSCKELGIETVSVHSTEDEESLHVKMADESVCIGPAKSLLSYLNIPSVLSAAEITNASAIHPGYGFLSESSEFAEMCEKWNLTFIGPRSEILELMGDKIESKKVAENAGVPTLRPVYVKDESDEEIVKNVTELGYPVIIKASAGGGGRGMQKVYSNEELLISIQRLQEEAKLAFGDGTLFVEKYIEHPRHIEVQIVGDKHGNIIHLFERDCTIQRRFQKIIEESPSVGITEEKRQEMCESAVNLAKKVNYDSVGTVEFLYDTETDRFYFMEMNTRIQVEHPVTEERCGIDLIALQIKIAMGHKLELKQSDIKCENHVIECRINAESSTTGMPCPGLITHYHRPGGPGVRVDDFIYTGYNVSPHYDSMISKIIVSAKDRESCILRMLRALDETVVGGISTNIELHKRILSDKSFRENKFSTNFLNQF
jgi:acetyl-CoA carboxylase biotin carboxylase subunit